jgi:hypothetical protein
MQRRDRADKRFAWYTLISSVLFMLAVTLPRSTVLAYKARCQTPEVRATLVGHPLTSLRCSAAEVYAEKYWWALGAGAVFLTLAVAMLILLRWMPAKERARREQHDG